VLIEDHHPGYINWDAAFHLVRHRPAGPLRLAFPASVTLTEHAGRRSGPGGCGGGYTGVRARAGGMGQHVVTA
jgi:hypothetical protein